ncbi:sulfite oxidase heme-binding subunit YedZ [Methyloversatilis discipulorum]|uniref:sulfite oxidase heme-binding subunit YedZ n=1 Tax=Methyloversatilis discipulorum TaxID=1119528 RepID=UPI0003771E0F|nr:protein-methionine-sulfoxide reductase heme-binding subunit MsrQ [Methyloversatilis discipulorum]
MRERAFSPDRVQFAWIWRAVWAACLLPLMLLVAGGLRDALGANPIEHITRATGDWTLRLLLLTLAVTPLRQLTGWHWLVRLRRTLGLYAFFYGSLHLATYVWLDQFFDWPGIVADIVKRPFVTLGFAAFVLMLPLAITSTNGMIRRLGGRSWQRLHRAVYAVGVLGVAHYWWLVKKDLTEPITYAFVLATLFALRLWHGRRMRRTLEAQAA